jgi:AcrR family transcriptional regulator
MDGERTPPEAPPPATRRAGRPRSEACDNAILDAALRRLAEDGYARMSMDGIAAEAGVSKATLYLRYRGKSDVATAALARLREEAERPPTGDLRADLVARLERGLEYARLPSVMPLLGTCLAEEHRTPELLALLRERGIEPRRAALRRILRDACDRGELRADADVEATIDLVLGAYLARHLSGGEMPAGWAGAVVDALLAGLAPGAREGIA